MKRIKKFMMILLVTVALITTMSINCYASELGHDEFEKIELETVSNPTSVITILVNYKPYLCTTSFVISGSGSSYHAGIATYTKADTDRHRALTITFNTVANGYVTKSNFDDASGTGELDNDNLVSAGEALTGSLYTSYAGSCGYYYNGDLKGTGFVNYSLY